MVSRKPASERKQYKFQIAVDEQMHNEIEEKVRYLGFRSASQVATRLMEKWLRGEISLLKPRPFDD